MTTPTKISLVLADVDGTLVTKDKTLTERAIEAVRQIHARGIAFAITSSRPPRGLRHLVAPLHITTPLAGFNGGLFVKPDTMEPIESHLIPDALVPQIIALLQKHHLDVWLFRGEDWYVCDENGAHVAHETHTVQFSPTIVPNFDALMTNVAKIVGVSDDFEAVAKGEADAQATFGDKVNALRSQAYYLDITHPDANKGAVARKLCELLHVPKDEFVTIGDQANDVSMFREAGFAVAMGNAPPDVQQQASAVTDTNENEGFAKAMEKFILKIGNDVPQVGNAMPQETEK